MADCSCIYDSGCHETPEFYCEKTPVARKQHKCSECGKLIEPGTRYYAYTGKWNSEIYTHKLCPVCEEIAKAFFCDGFTFETLYEYLSEHILEMRGEIRGECLAALSPATREVLCEMIETVWEEDDEDE